MTNNGRDSCVLTVETIELNGWRLPLSFVVCNILEPLHLSYINSFGFPFAVPGAPQILPRESSTENNTVTVVWQPHSGGGTADGYALELDDGNGGNFRVS